MQKERKRKGKQVENIKITTKLAVSYGVLVLCIIVVGLVSYMTASHVIMKHYEQSTLQSLTMLGEYLEYGFENVTAQAVDYLVDDELAVYLSGRMDSGERLSYYNKQKTSLTNKASVDPFIYNIFFLSDEVPSLSSGKKSVQNAFSQYTSTEQGKAPGADDQGYYWFGQSSELDELLEVDSDSYAIRLVKKFYKKNAMMVIDIDKQAIVDSLNRIQPGEGSRIIFITQDGRELTQDGSVEDQFQTTSFYEKANQSVYISGVYENIVYKGESYLFLFQKLEKTGAMVCVLIPNILLVGQVAVIKYIAVGMVIIASFLAVLIAMGISLGMNRTIKNMIYNMGLIAQGNMNIRMLPAGNSEFAQLAGQMNGMLDSVTSLLTDVKKVSLKVADSAKSVNQSSQVIEESASHISLAVEEIESGLSSQSRDTQSCCVQLDGLAEKIGEVDGRTKDIQSIAENTEEYIENSRQAIGSLKERAEETSEATQRVIDTIEQLQLKSNNIDTILNTVYDIADQTTLLSLNASIEAARAGVQGKGFWIIAEEIRKLAEQSMSATKKISVIVEEISQNTILAVETTKNAGEIVLRQEDAVDSATDAFLNMRIQVEQLMGNVSDITKRASEMSGQKEEALKNMESISLITETAVDSVITVNEKALRQKDEAGQLTELSGQMQSQVEKLEQSLLKFKL